MIEVRRTTNASPEAVWGPRRRVELPVVGGGCVPDAFRRRGLAGGRCGAAPLARGVALAHRRRDPGARGRTGAGATGCAARGGRWGRSRSTSCSGATESGGCEIVMREDVVAGPSTLIPKPLRVLMMKRRNAEATAAAGLFRRGLGPGRSAQARRTARRAAARPARADRPVRPGRRASRRRRALRRPGVRPRCRGTARESDRLRASEAGHRPEHQLLEQLCRATVDGAAVQVRVGTLQVAGPLHVAREHPAGEPGRVRLNSVASTRAASSSARASSVTSRGRWV